MEVKIESKIGQLRTDDSRIYNFLSDCNNFQQYTANDKIKNWHADSDSFGFSLDGIGNVSFSIVERRPNNLIKFSINNAQADNTFLWIQLKNANQGDTRVKLTAKMEVNPVVRMLISKPLQQGLDKIVETLETICW